MREDINDLSKDDNGILSALVEPRQLYMKTRFPLVKVKILKDELEKVDKECSYYGVKFTVLNGYYGFTNDRRILIRIGYRREDMRIFNKIDITKAENNETKNDLENI